VSRVVLYTPGFEARFTGIQNRVYQYFPRAHTPDYLGVTGDLGVTGAIINPIIPGATGVDSKYWKIDPVGETGILEMTSEEKTTCFNATTAGVGNNLVKSYSDNTLMTETWYNKDNGDETYSGKVSETVYNYSKNKIINRIEKKFLLDGAEIRSQQYDYFENTKGDKIEHIQKKKDAVETEPKP